MQAFKERLSDDRLVGITEDGQTRFFEQLNNQLFYTDLISEQDLRRYDLNIVGHWQRITAKRNQIEGHILEMKYFQYLSLLFTEIYLDWYFNRTEQLIEALNQTLANYREEPQQRDLQDYQIGDLNKIAFWNATGSGKTLLMHVNILQYLSYCTHKINQIIVLTPNEGLSAQHIKELKQSGFQAIIFDKNKANSKQGKFDFTKDEIQVIDVNKLGDKDGDKTVATAAFAGHNLVLVDEGHRGASGDAWMARREQLVDKGFAFEYSATFGQAVASGKSVAEQEVEIQKKKAKLLFGSASLRNLDTDQQAQLVLSDIEKQQARQTAMFEVYAKAVLFDYSYKFFYADGYGKESLILNLKDEDYQEHGDLYLTACLLSFYQQLYLFETHNQALQRWNIEKPLWVFVGNKVADDDSDVLKVLNFLAKFLNEPNTIQNWLHDLLNDTARLTDNKGNNIFFGKFSPLMDFLGKEAGLYADILQRLFNTCVPGRLQLTHLKKADGELALSVGGAEAFGVINIGDAKRFYKTASEQTAFDSSENDFADGLFQKINDKTSKTNLLIGSRKFSEGWSSWRVATMGLLNMGKKEGSQIIQLFGRGVRLKGESFSLKRSLKDNRPKGIHLEKLETLNIFGIAAGYMEQFKAYLREEGITPPDELLTVDFKVQPYLPANTKLRTLRLKDGYKDNQKLGFKRVERTIYLYEIPEKWQGKIKTIHAELDYYPKIEAYQTKQTAGLDNDKRQTHQLDKQLFEFFDWDKIYLDLWQYKLSKTWFNLRINKAKLRQFAEQDGWYKLYLPEEALAVRSFADIDKQQSILIDLLRNYTDRFYLALKAAYEGQFYETVEVDEQHPSLQNNYLFTIEASDKGKDYESKLTELKTIIEQGTLKEALDWRAPNITAICFERHLYYPIMSIDNLKELPLKMQPLDMKDGSEIKFINDLQAAYKTGKLHEWIGDKELYLLRNAANKSKGLGFALAGNFYPDFLLWLVDSNSGQQWLSFIDPKGIRNMSLEHPKFGLQAEVKKLEQELKLDVILNAFILSITKRQDLINVPTMGKQQFEDKHILFMEDEDYLMKMFQKILLITKNSIN